MHCERRGIDCGVRGATRNKRRLSRRSVRCQVPMMVGAPADVSRDSPAEGALLVPSAEQAAHAHDSATSKAGTNNLMPGSATLEARDGTWCRQSWAASGGVVQPR